MSPDSVDLLRKDHTSLAASVGSLVQLVAEIQKDMKQLALDRAVRVEIDARFHDRMMAMDERVKASLEAMEDRFNAKLAAISTSVEEVQKSCEETKDTQKWLFRTIIAGFVLAAVAFVVGGGLKIGG